MEDHDDYQTLRNRFAATTNEALMAHLQTYARRTATARGRQEREMLRQHMQIGLAELAIRLGVIVGM